MSEKKPITLEQVHEINQLLKAADRHTLAGEFDQALVQVEKALKIDPQNSYAVAYKERIHAFHRHAEEKKKKDALQEEVEAKLKAGREARRKAEEEAKAKAKLDISAKPFEERKKLST